MTSKPATQADTEQQLRSALRTGNFPLALQLSRERADLTVKSLAQHIRRRGGSISDTALNYWELGVNVPEKSRSIHALRIAESVLGLQDSALVRLVGPPRPRGPSVTAQDQTDAVSRLRRAFGDKQVAEWAIRIVGEDYLARHRTVDIHEFHTVGAQGRPERHETRQVVKAAINGVDRYFYMFDTRVAGTPIPAIRSAGGCRVGRIWEHKEAGVGIVELLFDMALSRGDTHLFEYETGFEYKEQPPPEFRRSLTRRIAMLLIKVQFHPECLPSRILRSNWPHGQDEPRDIEEVRLDHDNSVHLADRVSGPGLIGFRWEWPKGMPCSGA